MYYIFYDGILKSESGHSINSVLTYRQTVTQFYDFLPKEKVIGPNTVSQWQKYMTEQGYANSTNNTRLYVINHFMEFLGKAGMAARYHFEEGGRHFA